MSGIQRPAHAVTTEIRVAFHQCDPLGVVWHGRTFELLEVARCALLAGFRLDVPDIAALGFRMVVTEASCRYMAPLRYGDIAAVTAWFSAVSPLLRVAYDVRLSGGGTWCARAVTELATTDADGRLLPRTPDAILERLPAR